VDLIYLLSQFYYAYFNWYLGWNPCGIHTDRGIDANHLKKRSGIKNTDTMYGVHEHKKTRLKYWGLEADDCCRVMLYLKVSVLIWVSVT
jgi:hypothetical protein